MTLILLVPARRVALHPEADARVGAGVVAAAAKRHEQRRPRGAHRLRSEAPACCPARHPSCRWRRSPAFRSVAPRRWLGPVAGAPVARRPVDADRLGVRHRPGDRHTLEVVQGEEAPLGDRGPALAGHAPGTHGVAPAQQRAACSPASRRRRRPGGCPRSRPCRCPRRRRSRHRRCPRRRCRPGCRQPRHRCRCRPGCRQRCRRRCRCRPGCRRRCRRCPGCCRRRRRARPGAAAALAAARAAGVAAAVRGARAPQRQQRCQTKSRCKLHRGAQHRPDGPDPSGNRADLLARIDCPGTLRAGAAGVFAAAGQLPRRARETARVPDRTDGPRSKDHGSLPIWLLVDVVLIKVVMGLWRQAWPPLAGIAIGLLVAHAMRDRRAGSGNCQTSTGAASRRSRRRCWYRSCRRPPGWPTRRGRCPRPPLSPRPPRVAARRGARGGRSVPRRPTAAQARTSVIWMAPDGGVGPAGGRT